MRYSTTHRSKKCWKYFLWFLFDTAVTCVLILMMESPKHQSTSKTGIPKSVNQHGFHQNLARQLIGNCCQKSCHEATERDSSAKSHWPATMPKSRRCELCTTQTIRRESKYGYAICDVNLCHECFEPYHNHKFTEE